jgi:hypothetical protein
MNTYLRNGLIIVAIAAVSYGAGKFSNPAKVITKTEIKEVVKTVEVIKEQKNVVVITKKTTKKDGTIIEESKTEDKSVTFQDKSTESKKQVVSSQITTRDIGLSVHALALQNLQHTERDREYGVFVKKRVFGNISVGAMATDQRTFGLSVGMDF